MKDAQGIVTVHTRRKET